MTSASVQQDLLRELRAAVLQHSGLVAEIAANAGITGVVWRAAPVAQKAARELYGWPGGSRPWRLSKPALLRLASTDHVAAAFALPSDEIKVLVITGDGTLLVRITDDGWSIVGTDREVAS
jgi:hypothetical protein